MIRPVSAPAVHAAARPHLYHFEPSVNSASWSYGSGVHAPGRPGVGPSVNLNLSVPYVDVKPSFKVHIDEKKHQVVVTVDATSPSKIHPMVMVGPKDYNVPVKRPADIGASYTIVVKDIHGKTLAKSQFANMLPM